MTIAERADRFERAYYFQPSLRGENSSQAKMDTQANKIKYFEKVVFQMNPSAINIPRTDMAALLTHLTVAHAHNIVDTKALSELDPKDIHPLFGKVKMRQAERDADMELPMNAYVEGTNMLAERLIREYERVGQELPEELKNILNLHDDDQRSEGVEEEEASDGEKAGGFDNIHCMPGFGTSMQWGM
jgi:hypothetical protein